jgi:hypothetical protein
LGTQQRSKGRRSKETNKQGSKENKKQDAANTRSKGKLRKRETKQWRSTGLSESSWE